MLVTVYMPTKNRIGLLRNAVQSVLEQTYTNLELIVVDDGSTDGTRDFLASTANADARVKIVHNEQSHGPQRCRNAAISLARGPFVTGLDDDDQFLPSRLETFVQQWNVLQGFGMRRAFLYSQDEIYVNGSLFGYSRKKGSVRLSDLLISNEVGNQIFTQTKSITEIGGFREDLPAWQDFDLFSRLLSEDKQACLVDLPTYRFDLSPRPDRISAHRPRVRRAYEIVSASRSEQREQQQLMLQMYSPYYGFTPTIKEMWEFVRKGWWPHGFAIMIKRLLGRY